MSVTPLHKHATQPVYLASAYKRLNAHERVFVDSVIESFRAEAERRNDRISIVAREPIPMHIVERAGDLLERITVHSAIMERVAEIAADEELTPGRWLREVRALAFSNMGNYFRVETDAMGNEYPVFEFAKCTPEQLSAIKSIKVKMSGTGDGMSRASKVEIDFTLHDKQAPLVTLGKYMGMVEPDNPHWRADVARAAAPPLAAGATTQEAGDAYAAALGDT